MLEKNEIIQSALRNLKIEELNPMQEASLEQATGRKDVILLSPTGSGKTLAYLLPLLLTLKPNDDNVQVLILVPSRELALQIDSVFKAMGTYGKPAVVMVVILSPKKRRVYQAIILLSSSVLRDVSPIICLKEISIPKPLKL